MSDRCYLQVVVANSDVKRFMEIVMRRDNWSSVTEGLNATEFEEYEANYAMYDELSEAAKKGCLFYGYHGNGSEYGPGEFYGADNAYAERECGHNGGFVLPVRGDDILPEAIEELTSFLRERKLVKQRVDNPLYELVRAAT